MKSSKAVLVFFTQARRGQGAVFEVFLQPYKPCKAVLTGTTLPTSLLKRRSMLGLCEAGEWTKESKDTI